MEDVTLLSLIRSMFIDTLLLNIRFVLTVIPILLTRHSACLLSWTSYANPSTGGTAIETFL